MDEITPIIAPPVDRDVIPTATQNADGAEQQGIMDILKGLLG